MTQRAIDDTRRKAISYTLLFIGAAMPMVSVVVGGSSRSLADAILIGAFAVLAAAAIVALAGRR